VLEGQTVPVRFSSATPSDKMSRRSDAHRRTSQIPPRFWGCFSTPTRPVCARLGVSQQSRQRCATVGSTTYLHSSLLEEKHDRRHSQQSMASSRSGKMSDQVSGACSQFLGLPREMPQLLQAWRYILVLVSFVSILVSVASRRQVSLDASPVVFARRSPAVIESATLPPASMLAGDASASSSRASLVSPTAELRGRRSQWFGCGRYVL
jgi:hypothetical protein